MGYLAACNRFLSINMWRLRPLSIITRCSWPPMQTQSCCVFSVRHGKGSISPTTSSQSTLLEWSALINYMTSLNRSRNGQGGIPSSARTPVPAISPCAASECRLKCFYSSRDANQCASERRYSSSAHTATHCWCSTAHCYTTSSPPAASVAQALMVQSRRACNSRLTPSRLQPPWIPGRCSTRPTLLPSMW